MTRIFVQRGSSSNANRPPANSVAQSSQAASTSKVEEAGKQVLENQITSAAPGDQCESAEDKISKHDKSSLGVRGEAGQNLCIEQDNSSIKDVLASVVFGEESCEHCVDQEDSLRSGTVSSHIVSSHIVSAGSHPPPPPAPPPKLLSTNQSPRRMGLGPSNSFRIISARRQSAWSVVPTRSPIVLLLPGHVSSYDEQGTCYVSSYDDMERERLFELEIRRTKGFEVK